MHEEKYLENRVIELEAKIEMITNALLSVAKPTHKNFGLLALTIGLKANEIEQIKYIFVKAVTEKLEKQRFERLLIEALPERQNVLRAIAEALKADDICVSACDMLLN